MCTKRGLFICYWQTSPPTCLLRILCYSANNRQFLVTKYIFPIVLVTNIIPYKKKDDFCHLFSFFTAKKVSINRYFLIKYIIFLGTFSLKEQILLNQLQRLSLLIINLAEQLRSLEQLIHKQLKPSYLL